MDEKLKKQLLERRRRRNAAARIERTADDIFCRTYKYKLLDWIDLQAARGMSREEARNEAFRLWDAIHEELWRVECREDKIRYAWEHNDGFMDAAGEDIPFDDG